MTVYSGTVKLLPHPQADEPVGGVKWKVGWKGSSIQSITASFNSSKEVASEKIISVSISASSGRHVVGDRLI